MTRYWLHRLQKLPEKPSFHSPNRLGPARTGLPAEEQRARRNSLRARREATQDPDYTRFGAVVMAVILLPLLGVLVALGNIVALAILLVGVATLVGGMMFADHLSRRSERFARAKDPGESGMRPVAPPADQYRAGNPRVMRRVRGDG